MSRPARAGTSRRAAAPADRPLRQALLGAGIAWGVERALTASPLADTLHWYRTNHRRHPVSLLSGPALAVGGAGSADLPRAAAAVAALGAAVVGRYDDRAGSRHPGVKGLRGHLAALQSGRLTSGAVKAAGLTAVGCASALALRPRTSRTDLLLDGVVVAAAANLVNLLDLRPGRALKAGGTAALLLRQTGPAAAAAALLPGDLRERTMLGDCGANALGALLGLALVNAQPRRRTPVLVVLTALTAASEVVSYSRVIDAVPALRWLDAAGRLP